MSVEPDDDGPGVHERTMLVDLRELKARPERAERPERPERVERPERAERPERFPERPARPERPWRPFTFRNLEKVSRAQGLLAERLRWLTPDQGTLAAVATRLKELFDAPVHLSLESVQVRPLAELRRFLGDPTFLAVLAPGALQGRAVL